jgi:hypothetical protein
MLFSRENPVLGSTVIKPSVGSDVALRIQGDDAGQTGSLLLLENSAGTDVFSVSNAGAVASLLSLTAVSAQHLSINTVSDDKQVRINSRNFTTSGDFMAFQAKPAQAANGNTITGGQISPRVNDTFTMSGSVIGLHVDAYLKGTSAGTITGDVRGLNIELVTDDAGTRTISGNVSAIRIRSAFSGTTITGKFVPIRIEKAETQTNSKQYDAVLELPSTVAGVWNSAPGTEPTTADGYIKVLVNGAARYIQLYSGAPVD